jgi:hypothetical protein
MESITRHSWVMTSRAGTAAKDGENPARGGLSDRTKRRSRGNGDGDGREGGARKQTEPGDREEGGIHQTEERRRGGGTDAGIGTTEAVSRRRSSPDKRGPGVIGMDKS